ncbi:MAG: phosphoribosylamine--glycine ligase [Candidatus Marinimicrobia bacterium]|nr:phosphoribosylamine--glycine ligase [Candidatus Neomarinimicrobiota bacterium]
MNILLIGSGAREHAIARAVNRSPQPTMLYCIATSKNPGIQSLCTGYSIDDINDPLAIVKYSKSCRIDLAIIGPESPLAAGAADTLWDNGVPCVGPKQKMAQIETSKAFTRNLLAKYNVPGGPHYRFFNSLDGVQDYLKELGDLYVVKYDGLMGGKGVKVAGDHLHSHAEATQYCRELADAGKSFVIEEKLIGEEFSLMSFSDGKNLAHMPVVQDHKRAFEGDTGPNTGGMGSYSDADHSLPFLKSSDIEAARAINLATINALEDEFGQGYKGILYGGFIATKDGVKLIEYNARFGDPEGLNVLAILKSDFVAICQAIINGNLNQNMAEFSRRATVCKYAVPAGYPDLPVKNQRIDISKIKNPDQLYLAAVNQRKDGLYETGSRTAAVVGIAPTLAEAEVMAQEEVGRIAGPVFHRKDIGTAQLVKRRIDHMKRLLGD